jgi:hypothetical protein
MQLAQKRYKTMVDEKTWAAPSKEEEKIIASEARITKLSKKGKKRDPKKDKKGKEKQAPAKGNQNNSGPTRPAWKPKSPSNA